MLEVKDHGAVRKLVDDIEALDKVKKAIVEEIHIHITDLANFLQNSAVVDESRFRSDHETLEEEFTNFIKEFRLLKSRVFKTAEDVLRSEKLKHLLTAG
jgi:hypothetical protein